MEWHIAWRYLFSKKGHNAINIVSGVSAAAVAVVTAAMLCVMSVLNGFEHLVSDMFSEFDAPLRITAAEGKYFSVDTESFDALRALPYVSVVSEQVSENALIRYDSHQTPATVVGVDTLFHRLSHIENLVVSGRYTLSSDAYYQTIMGRGLAAMLGVNPYSVSAISLYAPRRQGRVNMLRPDESFNEESVFIGGLFAVNQVQYDDHLMLVPIALARSLFDYSPTEVTALCLSIDESAIRIKDAKRAIQRLLGDDFIVADRYEQQQDFYRIVRIEKLLTVLLLVFILLIAGFNVLSSLSMLIMDKRESIQILYHLGADTTSIRRIFLYEGWLISSLGAAIGLLIGLFVCLLQEHFGLLKLGSGEEYVIAAYPVVVEAADVLLVSAIVLLLGYVAAYFPTRKIVQSSNT